MPLFKRSWLDPYLLENYQPISNFPFLAKVVDNVGWMTATEDLRGNRLSGPISGSGCTQWSWDGDGVSILEIHDLLAAFNTVNHSILLDWLQRLDTGSTMHKWFISFLSGQFQSVLMGVEKINSTASLVYSTARLAAVPIPVQHLHETTGQGHPIQSAISPVC